MAGIAFEFVGIQHDVNISLNGTRGHRKVSPVFGCAAFSSLQLALVCGSATLGGRRRLRSCM
jgi:hypothetical protein